VKNPEDNVVDPEIVEDGRRHAEELSEAVMRAIKSKPFSGERAAGAVSALADGLATMIELLVAHCMSLCETTADDPHAMEAEFRKVIVDSVGKRIRATSQVCGQAFDDARRRAK
jgi:hypothetical protein